MTKHKCKFVSTAHSNGGDGFYMGSVSAPGGVVAVVADLSGNLHYVHPTHVQLIFTETVADVMPVDPRQSIKDGPTTPKQNKWSKKK